jgi:hypothetical protein
VGHGHALGDSVGHGLQHGERHDVGVALCDGVVHRARLHSGDVVEQLQRLSFRGSYGHAYGKRLRDGDRVSVDFFHGEQ